MSYRLPVIAVFIPSAAESSYLRRHLNLESLTRLATAHLYFGETKEPYDASYHLLLVQTGMGPVAAGKAAQYVFGHFPISEAWVFGYAGASDEGLQTGNALIADEVGADLNGEELWLKTHENLKQRAEALLDSKKIIYQRGRLFTSDRLIGSPIEKKELKIQKECLGIAMEGFPIAQEAQALGIPFLEIRWVLDPVHYPMPDLTNFVGGAGETRVGRGLLGLIQQPSQWGEFFSILPRVHQAKKGLDHFLEGWLNHYKE